MMSTLQIDNLRKLTLTYLWLKGRAVLASLHWLPVSFGVDFIDDF